MTEEFDEEVVFENSPLFQYLQDLGHSDFEACPTVSQEEEERGRGSGEGPFPQDVLAPLRRGLLWRLADAMWRLSAVHQGPKSNRMEQRLDVEFRQYSLRTLMDQDVLLQEDVELIELLDPSVLSTRSSSSRATVSLPGNRFLTPSIWDVSGLVAFVAVLAGLRSVAEGPGLAVLVPWALALAGFLLVRGVGLWKAAQLGATMRARGAQLERLALDSRALTGLIRKSLRLIQETEVISRGFTLLLDRVSAACPLNKAGGQQRGQQLLGLRKASYRALHSAFRASRLATCHMLNLTVLALTLSVTYPLNSEIDNVTNYLSTVPLKELGLGLGEVHLTDEQAQELTDDYSLPALKVLFQLWVGQSSEFYRRLALLLSPGREESRQGRGNSEKQWRDVRLMHQVVAEVTGPLHHTLSSCLGELQRSYDFHRYFETQRQSQGSDRASRARQKCHELNVLHTSVRSLQLHLKALLNEVIILEDELEKLMVSGETVETIGVEELQDRLRLLQPHMQASCGCWEDTCAQVDRMLHRVTNCPETPGTPEDKTPSLPPPQPCPVTLIHNRDPVPEEQELEAYVSDSDSDTEWRGVLLDLLSPEDPNGTGKRRRSHAASSSSSKVSWASVHLKWSGISGNRCYSAIKLPGGEGRHPSPDPVSVEEALLCHCDRPAGEGSEENGTECPPVARVPTLSATDRLTELHGSAAFGFNSALAAQVAARSHSFTKMEEKTYGDEEGDVTSQS
ncbi:hypothetical protein AGOR_G00249100 [Albula goreensis]|uniref:Vezatin n=1 Tax=Albula goreensis TaxID=1534307 RepID=A0A8T3CHW0_9TELE|nr:hypothetical protein AGOR_G00249100 [Albula goreensis]